MSEYKRLTVRTPKGIKLKRGRKYVELFADKSLTLNALNYLAELEDKEDKIESGLLLESPCKVGDIIYFNTFDRGVSIGIQPHKVKSIRVVITTEKSFPGSTDTEIYSEEIGDCVFLDKEQAEAWLKGLREGNK